MKPAAWAAAPRVLVALTAARSSRASPIPRSLTPGAVGQVADELLVEEAVPEPGERPALVAEDVHRDRPPAVDLAHHPVAGDVDVVERDLRELVGAVRLLDGPDLDAR